VYKQQIYQIAKSNWTNRFGSENRIETFFAQIGMLYSSDLELSVTILNISTLVYTQPTAKRKIFKVEDGGNSSCHIVGMPPDDDEGPLNGCVCVYLQP